MVHYRFIGVDTSSMSKDDLVNIGEMIGLGDMKKCNHGLIQWLIMKKVII